ncbi:MAG: fibronectin type III domain-containing protein [Succiniclasticum sp.]|nr:fibronectin type III domain-containing protein [Succiniclasticum sp.]
MANVNLVSDALKYQRQSGTWSGWEGYPDGTDGGSIDFNSIKQYAERFTTQNKHITRLIYRAYISTVQDQTVNDVTLTATLYTDDPVTGTPIAQVSKSTFVPGNNDFDFSDLSLDVSSVFYIRVHPTPVFDLWEPNFLVVTPSIAVLTYTDIPALRPSIVLPSGTKSGAEEILFSWENSGSGTQTKAELEWSTDGATWQKLTTVGSEQTYTAAANKFPAGTIYWHVRVTSSYGIVSDWVRGSFTVRYTGATVTLTSPTSGSRSGADEIVFGWSINAGDGTIQGTAMEISSDDGLTWTRLVDAERSVLSYTASAGQLPAGPLKWRVKAYNNRQSAAGDYGSWVQAAFTVTYDAVSQVVPVNSPTSGIISAGSSRTFSVALQASGVVYTPFTVSAATLYWRSGESGDFTAVTMTPSGNQASATIPAGTFPRGTIQWYAEATDNTGRTTRTKTFTLQALNAAVEAAPAAPINTLQSGSGPIVFRWTYGSIDGAPQGKAEIRYSTDGEETWHMLPTILGSATETTVPAGTFPGGTITWQVRAYNEAGTEGPWSSSVSFLSFAAPLVGGVTGDGKPFLTVSWQAEGQQAFEVEVNGKTYGPYYGENVRSYTLPEPLADGKYTARVRAQNRYGLWSEWAEGNVDVINVHGPTVPFGAESGESVLVSMFLAEEPPVITQQPQDITTNGQAKLTTKFIMPNTSFFKCQWFSLAPGATEWQAATSETTVSRPQNGRTLTLSAAQVQTYNGYKFRLRVRSNVGIVYSREALVTYGTPEQTSPLITGYFPSPTGYFLIYRDGVLIGKTYNTRFYDRTALGTHEYYALQVIPDGYYTRSSPSTATATASVKCPMIGKLDGGDFIKLKLSENRSRRQSFSRRRQVAYTQYAGAKFPAAELGEHESITGSFDVAYLQKDAAAADAFEALLGEAVILKTPGGKVVIGILEGLDLDDTRFYKSFSCTLQQMDWGEFVDETAGL